MLVDLSVFILHNFRLPHILPLHAEVLVAAFIVRGRSEGNVVISGWFKASQAYHQTRIEPPTEYKDDVKCPKVKT